MGNSVGDTDIISDCDTYSISLIDNEGKEDGDNDILLVWDLVGDISVSNISFPSRLYCAYMFIIT